MAALDDALRLRVLDACGLLDGSTLNPQLGHLTDIATRAIGAPVALVSLVTPSSQVFAGMTGLTGWAAEERETPLSHSFCQFVVVDESNLVIQDARRDPRLRDNLAIRDLGVIAYLGVPVRGAGGEVLGSFCVIDGEPREWSAEDVVFVETLADAASLAIQRQTRFDGLMADLRRRLAPNRLPSVEWADMHGSYQAIDRDDLGGDFYDAFVGVDGRVSITLGDIVGHGVDATLAMGQLRAAVGVQMFAGHSLETVFATLDDYVADHFPDIRSAALSLTSVWPDGRVQHLRGGAWPPLILSPTGDTRSLDRGNSWPLATFRGTRPPATETRLESGDTLVVFSDGLPESHQPDPRLAQMAMRHALADLGRAPLAEFHAHLTTALAPPNRRTDDLALITLRRR